MLSGLTGGSLSLLAMTKGGSGLHLTHGNRTGIHMITSLMMTGNKRTRH
jgi:hypothetical protein